MAEENTTDNSTVLTGDNAGASADAGQGSRNTNGAAAQGDQNQQQTQGGETKTPEQIAAEQATADKAAAEAFVKDGFKKNDGESDADFIKRATAEKAAKDAVPEKYDIKAPEGLALDEALLGEFTPLAKELGLSNEKAQKLADFYGKTAQANAQRQVEAWNQTINGWLTEAKADKEIGGANFDASVADAKSFINAFGDASLKQALDLTGVGNHPAFIKAFAKAGKAVREANLHFGGAGQGAPKDVARSMYPTMDK